MHLKSDGHVIAQAWKWWESLPWVSGVSHEPQGYVLCQDTKVSMELRQVPRVFVLCSCVGSWL